MQVFIALFCKISSFQFTFKYKCKKNLQSHYLLLALLQFFDNRIELRHTELYFFKVI